MTAEEWKPVPGFPDYEVSSFGRVLSRHGRQPRVLKPFRMGNYLGVGLCGPGGATRRVTLHVLVAEVFIGPRPEGNDVRHLDGNHRNNTAENLAYGTRSENVFDRIRHGTHHYAMRTHCKWGHPFDEANTRYGKSGRECRACSQRRLRQHRATATAERVA